MDEPDRRPADGRMPCRGYSREARQNRVTGHQRFASPPTILRADLAAVFCINILDMEKRA
jgi:hypothetical protein